MIKLTHLYSDTTLELKTDEILQFDRIQHFVEIWVSPETGYRLFPHIGKDQDVGIIVRHNYHVKESIENIEKQINDSKFYTKLIDILD
jgi:hypothetical protein